MTDGRMPKGARFDMKTKRWTFPEHHEEEQEAAAANAGGGAQIRDSKGKVWDYRLEIYPASELKRGERGVVVSDGTLARYNISRDGNMSRIPDHTDDDVVRSALFFFEQVDAPRQRAISIDDPDPMVEIGDPVFRTQVHIDGRVNNDTLLRVPFATFHAREQKEPGAWAMWARAGEQLVHPEDEAPGAGFSMLIREGIVLPSRDVPTEDVIAFRESHREELLAMRESIDRLALKIAKSGFDPVEMRIEVDALDAALAASAKAARKWNRPKLLGDLEIKFNWSSFARFLTSGAALQALAHGLPATAAVIGNGALSSLDIKQAPSFKQPRVDGPYLYQASIVREFGG